MHTSQYHCKMLVIIIDTRHVYVMSSIGILTFLFASNGKLNGYIFKVTSRVLVALDSSFTYQTEMGPALTNLTGRDIGTGLMADAYLIAIGQVLVTSLKNATGQWF